MKPRTDCQAKNDLSWLLPTSPSHKGEYGELPLFLPVIYVNVTCKFGAQHVTTVWVNAVDDPFLHRGSGFCPRKTAQTKRTSCPAPQDVSAGVASYLGSYDIVDMNVCMYSAHTCYMLCPSNMHTISYNRFMCTAWLCEASVHDLQSLLASTSLCPPRARLSFTPCCPKVAPVPPISSSLRWGFQRKLVFALGTWWRFHMLESKWPHDQGIESLDRPSLNLTKWTNWTNWTKFCPLSRAKATAGRPLERSQ